MPGDVLHQKLDPINRISRCQNCLTVRMHAGAEGPQDKDGKLCLLVDMFSILEPALVRDVLYGVQGDLNRALQQLLDIQV